jgi:hypothetical protein
VRIYCGRSFSDEDILTIRELIQNNPRLKRTPLSRQVCDMLHWRQPNGALKAMTARVALLRMQADGLIQLPPSQNPKNGRRPPIALTAASDPQPLLCRPVHELPPLRTHVLSGARSRLWNEYVARYHYLGYTPLSGSQMRYEIFSTDQLVALISFGASAWKLAARERFISIAQARQFNRLDSRFVAQTRSVRSRTQFRGRLAFVDECQAQRLDLLVNHAACVDVGYRDVERIVEMHEPLFGEDACDRHEIVPVLKRQIRGGAVGVCAAEPFEEEMFLC